MLQVECSYRLYDDEPVKKDEIAVKFTLCSTIDQLAWEWNVENENFKQKLQTGYVEFTSSANILKVRQIVVTLIQLSRSS